MLGTDATKDLAVIEICCNRSFQAIPFGDSRNLQLGEEVVALGYPLGVTGLRITRGVISSDEEYEDGRYLRQTDAAINPGNSGGPLINLQGHVIGVNTFIIEDTTGIGFAVTEQTISAALARLESGQSASGRATPTPSYRPTPTPNYRPPATDTQFGPTGGALSHELNFIESFDTDINVSSFYASVNIINPYSSSRGNWDFCLAFRDYGTNNEETYHLVTVTSDERYRHSIFENGQYNGISSGSLLNLRLGNGDENSVLLLVIEDRGWLFINSQFVDDLDLRDYSGSGSVWLGTGCTQGYKSGGSVTRFEELYVREITPSYRDSGGTLAKEPGFIAAQQTNINFSGAYVRATFTNPSTNNWSYGFIFRNDEDNRFYSTIIEDDGSWILDWRPGDVDNERELDSGTHRSILTGRAQVNTVELLYIGGFGALYNNGELISTLNLEDSNTAGDVSAAAWFYAGEPAYTDIVYRDFEVRSLD